MENAFHYKASLEKMCKIQKNKKQFWYFAKKRRKNIKKIYKLKNSTSSIRINEGSVCVQCGRSPSEEEAQICPKYLLSLNKTWC